MSQSNFNERLSRLGTSNPASGQSDRPRSGDRENNSNESKPWSLPMLIFKFVLCWGGFFLTFGFVHFLGTLGVESRPTRWMLELGLNGIAGMTCVFSLVCIAAGYMESRGMIASRERK